MDKIKLIKTRKGWIAKSDIFVELFNTDEIMTPYGPGAPAEEVYQNIKRLNKDSEVIICI